VKVTCGQLRDLQVVGFMAYRMRGTAISTSVMEVLAAATAPSQPRAAEAMLQMLSWSRERLPANCSWMEICILPKACCEDSDQEEESRERQEAFWRTCGFEIDREGMAVWRAMSAVNPPSSTVDSCNAIKKGQYHVKACSLKDIVATAKDFMSFDHNGLTYLLRTLEKATVDHNHWHCAHVVSDKAGKPIGFTACRISASRRTPMLEVLALYVRSELRELRLGTTIVTNLLCHAASGVNGEDVNNTQARVTLPFCMQSSVGFWKRFGCDTSAKHFAILRTFEKMLDGHGAANRTAPTLVRLHKNFPKQKTVIRDDPVRPRKRKKVARASREVVARTSSQNGRMSSQNGRTSSQNGKHANVKQVAEPESAKLSPNHTAVVEIEALVHQEEDVNAVVHAEAEHLKQAVMEAAKAVPPGDLPKSSDVSAASDHLHERAASIPPASTVVATSWLPANWQQAQDPSRRSESSPYVADAAASNAAALLAAQQLYQQHMQAQTVEWYRQQMSMGILPIDSLLNAVSQTAAHLGIPNYCAPSMVPSARNRGAGLAWPT